MATNHPADTQTAKLERDHQPRALRLERHGRERYAWETRISRVDEEAMSQAADAEHLNRTRRDLILRIARAVKELEECRAILRTNPRLGTRQDYRDVNRAYVLTAKVRKGQPSSK
jgi:hypothetical protein